MNRKISFSNAPIALLVATIILSCIYLTKATEAKVWPLDSLVRYGKNIKFEIFRNNNKVGQHEVRFVKMKDGWRVITIVTLDIPFLFFKTLTFDYLSLAKWDARGLKTLRVKGNDDGDHFYLKAFRLKNQLKILTKENSYTEQTSVFPTNHWNPNVLSSNRVLNTVTGNINHVNILKKEYELVNTEKGMIQATRYIYRGDIETEVWYDKSGRWVKMQFQVSDGSTLQYKCLRCQGGHEIPY